MRIEGSRIGPHVLDGVVAGDISRAVITDHHVFGIANQVIFKVDHVRVLRRTRPGREGVPIIIPGPHHFHGVAELVARRIGDVDELVIVDDAEGVGRGPEDARVLETGKEIVVDIHIRAGAVDVDPPIIRCAVELAVEDNL